MQGRVDIIKLALGAGPQLLAWFKLCLVAEEDCRVGRFRTGFGRDVRDLRVKTAQVRNGHRLRYRCSPHIVCKPMTEIYNIY